MDDGKETGKEGGGGRAVVVMPTYNEKENVEAVTRAILDIVDVDIVVVDDNSPDGTGQLAERLHEQDPRVHVLHRKEKKGIGKAYIAGFNWAIVRGYDYIIEMDADFSHNPKYLPDLLRLAGEYDFVLGSRNVEGGGTENWPLGRKIISKGGSLYARTVLGVGVRDLTGGFKCFRRRVLEAIDLDEIQSSGYGFQIEMTYRAIKKGFRYAELPIIFADRAAGTSKMSARIFLEALTMVWKLRFTVR